MKLSEAILKGSKQNIIHASSQSARVIVETDICKVDVICCALIGFFGREEFLKFHASLVRLTVFAPVNKLMVYKQIFNSVFDRYEFRGYYYLTTRLEDNGLSLEEISKELNKIEEVLK